MTTATAQRPTEADVRAAIAEGVEEGWLKSRTADLMYAILDDAAARRRAQ